MPAANEVASQKIMTKRAVKTKARGKKSTKKKGALKSTPASPVNLLYYGDNLEVLRRHVKGESVDLIYLDPPFKSNQAYNVLFAERNGSAIKGPVLKHVCRLFRCR